MAIQYRVHDKEKDIILESKDFVLMWNNQYGRAIKRWRNFFESNFPGRFEIIQVEWDNKDAVLNYIKRFDYGDLIFEPVNNTYFNNKIEINMEEGDSLNTFVFKLLKLSRQCNSVNKKNNYKETNYSRNRSSIDLWRHARIFRPEITIFEIMEQLYKLSKEKNITSQYCGNVHRRVFSWQGNSSYSYTNLFHNMYKDEYGLTFPEWEDISKEIKTTKVNKE